MSSSYEEFDFYSISEMIYQHANTAGYDHYVEYTVPPGGLKVWGGTTQIFIPSVSRQIGNFNNLTLIPINL